MSTAQRFSRIVSIVADLTRRSRAGQEAPAVSELARHYAVPDAEIAADIRALTLLGEHADSSWLLSLSVWQQDDRVSVTSAGPFRRPLLFSPDEQLAIQVALALAPGGQQLATRFAAIWSGNPLPGQSPPIDGASDSPDAAIRRALRKLLVLEMEYAGEGELEPRWWSLFPHQLVESNDRTYLVAWAPEPGAWRHFRLDRVLSARTGAHTFEPRPDFVPLEQPEDVFRPAGYMDTVTVRFRSSVAHWVAERYPEHEILPNGELQVHLTASSPDWLVRRVLEFGPDAEVIGPAPYREAMRQAVA